MSLPLSLSVVAAVAVAMAVAVAVAVAVSVGVWVIMVVQSARIASHEQFGRGIQHPYLLEKALNTINQIQMQQFRH